MLYLASQSPRRRALLQQLGIDPRMLDVDVPEQQLPDEPAQDYVSRVAREKAGAGLLQVMALADAVVLGADTEVVLDIDARAQVLGKPANADTARTMLRSLSGRTHAVISAVWVISAAREAHALSISQVTFAALDAALIDNYVACDEWRGKAGGYAIQGRGAVLIERLTGSYSGVMGLPLFETARLLREFGVEQGMGNGDLGMDESQ
ncbi:MAG: Maf family protein [Lysobacteraceae bacterium]